MNQSIYSTFVKPTVKFCEFDLNGWIAQPANSTSAILIIIAGIIILTRKKHLFSAWLGWTVIIAGLASFVYHATMSGIGQLIDYGSLFLLASVLVVIALRYCKINRYYQVVILFIGTIAPLLLTIIVKTLKGISIGVLFFSLLLIIAIVIEIYFGLKNKNSLRLFLLSFLVFFIGYVFWLLDHKLIMCTSYSHYINGHAIWHITNAVALILLDAFYQKNNR